MLNEIDDALLSFDPTTLHPSDAVAVLDAATALERRAVAIRTLVADRAADSSAWTRSGHRSAEDWLATKSDAGFGQARAILETSRRLEDLPQLHDALRKGELSQTKLNDLGPAATPQNEQRLLAAAKTENAVQFKKTCAAEKARARSAEEEAKRHARIHRERHHRSWTDAEGAYCYAGRTTAEVGARWEAAIAAEADRVFKAAHKEGRREPAAAYRSDAVGNLLLGGGASVDTTVVIRVDEARLRGGEGRCEAVGVGPVPVDAAIGAIVAGAFVKVLATDGVDVQRVAHPGRNRPAVLDTAIVERDEYRCQRPGCGATQRLQVHHYRVDYAKAGPTEYWNLVTLCRFDHDLVTHRGHRIDGGPGKWTWIPPP